MHNARIFHFFTYCITVSHFTVPAMRCDAIRYSSNPTFLRPLVHRNWIDNSRFADFVHIINSASVHVLRSAHRKLIMCRLLSIQLVWVGNKRHFYVVTFSRNFWLHTFRFEMFKWNSSHMLSLYVDWQFFFSIFFFSTKKCQKLFNWLNL